MSVPVMLDEVVFKFEFAILLCCSLATGVHRLCVRLQM